MADVFYGEQLCDKHSEKKGACRNKGYYRTDNNEIRCGVHSKKGKRQDLPKNPNGAERRQNIIEQRQLLVEAEAEQNRENGVKGKIILTKLRMMREPEHIDGYLKVFPNYKHQNRVDGYGCMKLSPKAMGPINHGQPGLPVAKNLENFHQGNKVFPEEADEKNEPTERFFKTQLEMYNDDIPHRHKAEARRQNAPLYSLWVRPNGEKIKLSYFDSRQFYCNYYERIAMGLEEFKELERKRDNGYNLQIIGYDAYEVADINGDDDHGGRVEYIDTCYHDISRPFGHELVLFTMLQFEPKDYPWRRFKTEQF